MRVTEDFINKLAADLFASQQEITFQMKRLKSDFERVSEKADSAAVKADNAALKAEETARATREMATGFHELSLGFQTLNQTMTGLASTHDGQADKLSQLIQALGGLLTSNVTAEIWRQQAEQRLSRIEDWIDNRDEAS